MADVGDLFPSGRPQPGRAAESPNVVHAVVYSVTDTLLEAVVPSFSAGYRFEVDSFWPGLSPGDVILLAFDETGQPWQVGVGVPELVIPNPLILGGVELHGGASSFDVWIAGVYRGDWYTDAAGTGLSLFSDEDGVGGYGYSEFTLGDASHVGHWGLGHEMPDGNFYIWDIAEGNYLLKVDTGGDLTIFGSRKIKGVAPGAATGDVVVFEQLAALALEAELETLWRQKQSVLVGGGAFTVTGTRLAWASRMLDLGAGNTGAGWPTYTDVNMPASGTTIFGHGGAPDATVNAAGIDMSPGGVGYGALWFDRATGFYHYVSYASSFDVPASWLLIAVRTQDDNAIRLATGQILNAGETTSSTRIAPADAGATIPALRTLGAGATQAAAGNHSHAEADVTGLVADLAGKQPIDGDLTAIAALATTAFGRSLLELANSAALLAAAGAAAASHSHAEADVTGLVADLAAKQPLDSDLTSIAALATTAYGRGLLTLADAAAARSSFGVPTVTAGTSFPGSPAAGDLHFYPLSGVTTAPTGGGVGHWQFRWNSTTSKWDFVGGPSLFAEVATDEAMGNAGYSDLTGGTVGPSITVPLAGDYNVEIQAECLATDAARAFDMSYAIGGTAAADADASHVVTGGAFVTGYLRRERRKTLAASTALVSKYKTNGGGAGVNHFLRRAMKVTPAQL